MSHKRKGQLIFATEWAKHLRKFLKRQFWKAERKAGQVLITKELKEKTTANIGFMQVGLKEFK